MLALPADEMELLSSQLELVDLPADSLIAEQDGAIPFVHFPQTAVLSSIMIMNNGEAIEAITMGYEGFAGLPVFLGASRSATRVVAQVPGYSRRAPAGLFQKTLRQLPALRRLLKRYTLTVIDEISRTAACNRLHSLDQRCARWLLLTHDRVLGDEFELTQEYLSNMLGVRRAGVSGVAAKLQKEGLIRYSRGRIRILDRDGLEKTVCECYRKFSAPRERTREEPEAPRERKLVGA